MKFSVTIPAYKAKFLHECIESVLSQTYSDFELIIVNDASPEDLGTIVKSFNDPRIHYYVNEKNCGAVNVVDNWNKCLEHATGDYVICMGDDDKLCLNCLEDYVKLINEYPGLALYHTRTEIINENSKVIIMQESRPTYENVYSMMWGRWNGRLQYIGDFLFDRQILLQNGGFYKLPLAWCSDDISAYMAASKKGVANTQCVGFQYRINSQSISKSNNSFIKLNAINKAEEWFNFFLRKEPNKDYTIEHTFWCMLKSNLPKMLQKIRIRTISTDLASNKFHLFKYFINMKKFHINFSIIVFSLIKTFYTNKYNF